MNGVDDEQRGPEAEPVTTGEPEAVEPVAEDAAPADAAEVENVAPAEEAAAIEPEPAIPSGRWLVLQATSLLRAVATQNYVCFGAGGVPRHGTGERVQAGRPATLDASLTLHGADGTVRLGLSALRFTSLRFTSRETVWNGFDPARQLQALWVWDYYRIQSHVALRVALPSEGGALPDAWRATLDAVRAAQAGDAIVLDVSSACGDFEQRHTLLRGAVEWERGGS